MSISVETIEPGIFAGTVADEIIAILADAVAERGRATFVLAGGRTPGSVYRALVIPPRVTGLDWTKVTCFVGDERWVPFDDQRSNFHMAQTTLLSGFGTRGPKAVAVDTSLKSPLIGAKDYSESIAKNFNLKAGELPTFDLVLLGMGVDGHIASLFPNSALLSDWTGIAGWCAHPTDGSERVTLLPGALFSAAHVLFIVTGNDKSETVAKVLGHVGTETELPARLCEKAKGKVTWFLDSQANPQTQVPPHE